MKRMKLDWIGLKEGLGLDDLMIFDTYELNSELKGGI